LGEENLKSAVAILFKAVKNSEQAIIIVDPDADGFTASATLINYLHNICPSWIENNL
jgi:single-stranded DNA-specific DHH superfamily exonuclease